MNAHIDVPAVQTTLFTDQVRQGVTGHNVRYVLGFGLAGVVIGMALIGFLASQGWLGTLG
jgi:hypothetical protein